MKTILALCCLLTALPILAEQVLYYDFNQGSGTTVSDAQGSTNGTIMGAGASSSWTEGKYGGGIVFTGENYVSVPFQFPDNGSVALWYKPDSLYNYNTIFDNSSNSNRWEMWIQGDPPDPWPSWYECPHCIKFRTGENSVGKVGYDLYNFGTEAEVTQMWFHFAATWTSAGESKLYVNGVHRDTQNSPDFESAGNTIYLGGMDPSWNSRAIGTLDEFRVYDNVLSVSDVQNLYDSATRIRPGSRNISPRHRNGMNISCTGNAVVFSASDPSITSVHVSDLRGRRIASHSYRPGETVSMALPAAQQAVLVVAHTASGPKPLKVNMPLR